MPRAPRTPRAHAIALAAPAPTLSAWREWAIAAAAVALLLAGLLAR